jgi:hypothetical protein
MAGRLPREMFRSVGQIRAGATALQENSKSNAGASRTGGGACILNNSPPSGEIYAGLAAERPGHDLRITIGFMVLWQIPFAAFGLLWV